MNNRKGGVFLTGRSSHCLQTFNLSNRPLHNQSEFNNSPLTHTSYYFPHTARSNGPNEAPLHSQHVGSHVSQGLNLDVRAAYITLGGGHPISTLAFPLPSSRCPPAAIYLLAVPRLRRRLCLSESATITTKWEGSGVLSPHRSPMSGGSRPSFEVSGLSHLRFSLTHTSSRPLRIYRYRDNDR